MMNNINFAINNNYDIVVNEVNNIIPTDEFLEENYIEQFTGDLFRSEYGCRGWDTELHKFKFEEDSYNISNFIVENKITFDNYDALYFNKQGTKFIFYTAYQNILKSYDLTTSGDISSFTNLVTHNPVGFPANGKFTMSKNGINAYIATYEGLIYQCDFSSAFDITTISLGDSIQLPSNLRVFNIAINYNGSKLYVSCVDILLSEYKFIEYNLSKHYNLSTIDLDNSIIHNSTITYFTLSSNDNVILGTFNYNNIIYQYNLDNQNLPVGDLVPYVSYSSPFTFFAAAPIILDGFNKMYAWIYDSDLDVYNLIQSSINSMTAISNSIVKNTTGTNNEYKHVTLYANGTNLDDITFYIGENNNSTITYTELPTTGSTTTRQSQRVELINENNYGLNWKAVGAEGSEIKKLQITYEKE